GHEGLPDQDPRWPREPGCGERAVHDPGDAGPRGSVETRGSRQLHAAGGRRTLTPARTRLRERTVAAPTGAVTVALAGRARSGGSRGGGGCDTPRNGLGSGASTKERRGRADGDVHS